MESLDASLAVNSNTSYSLLDIMAKGGILMIPLALLFILSIYIFFNKFFLINRYIHNSNPLINSSINYLKANHIEEVLKLCNSHGSLIAKLIKKIILNLGKPIKDIRYMAENTAKVEIYKVEKSISILSLIAAIAPMVGFVGTVIGVIEIFFNISKAGEININVVAGGLYVKLITSATGLIVGIISYVLYHILDNKLDNLAIYIEEKTEKILEVLENPI